MGQIEVSLPISTEGVDQAFVKMLLESKLGKVIESEIEKVLTPGCYETRNIVQKAVQQAVRSTVAKIVSQRIEERREAIVKVIAERLTDAMIEEFVAKAWEHAINNM